MQLIDLHYRIGHLWLFKALAASFTPGITVISGANGCGKSTLLRVLAGICRPDNGKVIYQGKDLYATKCKEKICYVPSMPFLFSHLSVEENFYLIAMLRQMTKRAFDARLPIVLEQFKIQSFNKVLFAKCSDGIKKRIMLASAWLNNPQLIILDEPCAALCADSRKELWLFLHDYAKQGNYIILSTHHPEEICDHTTTHYLLKESKLTLNKISYKRSPTKLMQEVYDESFV